MKYFSKEGFRFDAKDDFPGVDIDELEQEGVRAFLENNDWEPHRNEHNKDLMVRGDAPSTRKNLELLLRDLKDQLVKNPPAPGVEPDKSRGIIKGENALAEWKPDSAERRVLASVADNADLSDHQRKLRDKKLAALASRQRRELAQPRRPDDRDPLVVI